MGLDKLLDFLRVRNCELSTKSYVARGVASKDCQQLLVTLAGDDVIDQPSAPHPGRYGDERSRQRVVEGDQGGGVHDGQVVEAGSGFGLEDLVAFEEERGGVAGPGCDALLDVLQCAMEDEGLLPFVCGEVTVAAAEGEAVGVADDGAADEFDVEVEVADHVA